MSQKNRLVVLTDGDHPLKDHCTGFLNRKGMISTVDDNYYPDMLFLGGKDVDVRELSDKHPDLPMLLLSSSDIYKGTFLKDYVDEGTAPAIHPLADFAPGAIEYLNNEMLALTYHKGPVMVVRAFPTFGFGPEWLNTSPEDTILSRLVKAADDCEPEMDLIWGTRRRSWIHMSDFLEGFLQLLLSLMRGTTGIYNLGSEFSVTLHELSRDIFRSKGLPVENKIEEDWKELPWRPNVLVPDMRRTQAITKWRPRVSVRAGLK